MMDVFGELLAPKYLQWLWQGFQMTIWLSLLVCVASTVVGMLVCVVRLDGPRFLSALSRTYLSVFRNTPLLVQLFFWYFGAAAALPDGAMEWLNTPREIVLFGWTVAWPSFEFVAGFWGLTLFSSAFIAEEFRAGVQGVSLHQRNAGAALGMTRWQVWRWVVLPQALHNAFSPLVGQYMNVVKNSSLTMAIGLAELSYASRQVETETFKTFQAFGIATLLYLILVVVMDLLAQAWQRHRRLRHGTR